MTTLGMRSGFARSCVNLPGFKYTVDALGLPGVQPCPVNTYNVGLRRQRSCWPCPAGYTTNGLTGATDIDSCVVPPGYYMRFPTIVYPCPKGEHKENAGPDTSCTPCPTGVTTAAEASVSRTLCTLLLPGFYAAAMNRSMVLSARPCPYKFYCVGGKPLGVFNTSNPAGLNPADATVKPCPDGMWTRAFGASTQDECMTPPGHYTANGTRVTLKCPAGTYRANWASSGRATECTPCGTGFFTTNDTQIDDYIITTNTSITIPVATQSSACYIKPGQGVYYQAGAQSYRSRNCDGNNWGVNTTTYGLTISNCRPCPLGMVASSNTSSYPRSSSYYVDNGDGTGGFISLLACVTPPRYGVSGNRAVPCPAGTYNSNDNYDGCTACSAPLTTAWAGAGMTAADCGVPAGYGFHGGSLVLCPVGTYNDAAIKFDLTAPCTTCPTGMTTASAGSTSASSCYNVTCASPPGAALTYGSWPPSCVGRNYSELCVAQCSFGGAASVNCMADMTWNSTLNGDCSAPTNCSGVPTAPVIDGNWPSACAEAAIGARCSANCSFGGSSNVTCLTNGSWTEAATGACTAAPTNCSSTPSVAVADGSWPPSCAGAAFGATCSASCTWGGSASVTCQTSGLWDAIITGSCAAPPTNCPGSPGASVTYGTWPAACAGAAIGATCSATCSYGGSAAVTCQASGSWAPLVTGSCSAPTNCLDAPTAPVTWGSWPGGCAGMATGATCSASCSFGGAATVTCQATGAWDAAASGSCDVATNCTALPTASLQNGSWPSTCAQAAFGADCSANCTFGGSANVTCLTNGSWSGTATGACDGPPPSCSGLPSPNPVYGTWPSSCAGITANQTCTATCTFGGAASVGCQADGVWNSTEVGSCNPGATAFVAQTGLGNDKLWVCNLTAAGFSACVGYSGFSALRASYASGNTVWITDDAGGTVTVCNVAQATNGLSGCIVSTLTGYGGGRDPVALTVKDGVAFVANRDSACGVVRCTNAVTMTGCSCALTSAQNAINVRGISLSPDGNTLYFTSNTNGVNYGIVACSMSGTTIGTCSVYNSNTILTAVYSSGSKLYVVTRFVDVLLTYIRVWVCDPTIPDPATCVRTGQVFGTGALTNDPWGMSVFNGVAYVPDNDAVERCTNIDTVDSCTTTGLNLAPLWSGASSIFIVPRP